MKSIEEKRDELAEQHYKTTGWVPTEFAVMNFHAGWNACAKEYEKQLEIAKESLRFYAEFFGNFKPTDTPQDIIINWGHTAQEALKVLNNG